MASSFIYVCKLIDISKHSKWENLDFKIYASFGIWTRDLSQPERESYLYTMYTIIAGLLHRILAFIDIKVIQVQPTTSWSLW